jgi:UDP-galactopyranose mutase
MYDFTIVGCGMFGACFARRAADLGATVLVVDRRDHIGGNCYTSIEHGIHVHRYGPHIFHANSARVWAFVNRFTKFNDYRHRVHVRVGGREFPFPITLNTLAALWELDDDAAIVAKLAAAQVPIARPVNLEEWVLSQAGEELYDLFFRGYTEKQWDRAPRDLPVSIARRVPIRLSRCDDYFLDRFQGIPIDGYTRMFENMLDHEKITVELGTDFLAERSRLQRLGRRVVFSGQIDQFFDRKLGELSYRSLRFEHFACTGTVQSVGQVNFTDRDVPYTRVIEHKHFMSRPPGRQTVVSREYPVANYENPFYPVRDRPNLALLRDYRRLARRSNVVFGGRLGSYQYFDMHQVIAQALTVADRECRTARVGIG